MLDSYAKKEAGVQAFPKSVSGVDYGSDFFKAKSYLTVSGQLAVENYCCALSNVYTFGPTFRAEDSHTKRHLAEFWMIEPELAFADLMDVMQCAEDYLKYCVSFCLSCCQVLCVIIVGVASILFCVVVSTSKVSITILN